MYGNASNNSIPLTTGAEAIVVQGWISANVRLKFNLLFWHACPFISKRQ